MFDGKVLENYTGTAIEELAAASELNSIAPIQVTNIRVIRFGVLFAVNISISRFRIRMALINSLCPTSSQSAIQEF